MEVIYKSYVKVFQRYMCWKNRKAQQPTNPAETKYETLQRTKKTEQNTFPQSELCEFKRVNVSLIEGEESEIKVFVFLFIASFEG